MARTFALYLLPAVLIPTAWLRLEVGASDPRVFWLVVLALLPALVRLRWARIVAAAAAMAVAARVTLGVSPLEARPFSDEHDFFGPLWERFTRGALDFYDVAQPFRAAAHPAMHDVVLVAIFAFCLVAALAIGARRPLLAGLALLAGSMWPATLVAGSDLARGAVTLGALLVLLAAGRDRPATRLRPAAAAAVALVAAAVAASTSPAVAKDEFLAWQTWDPYDAPSDPVGVRYVWDANYGGIRFPEKKTVVMTITAPPDSDYWRATTLDVFTDDRWIERLDFRFQSDERQTLHHEELTPSAAASIGRWVRADVRVEALRDRHLVGGSMPVAFDPGDAGTVSYLTGNVAIAQEALERADDYTVWSYVPRPTPAQLDRARHTRVQQGLARYLEVAPGVAAPLFGTPRRGTALRRLFADRELRPYERLYREARRVVGRPKSAYAAVVALEAWFRSEGGFVYEEQPDLAPDTPPLVDFVARTQEGYCQQFAGAMALMLRYLGIPARIGAGFTSGTYDRQKGQWTVTDHNAHTWVEVWFPRYGWLPFDPTPARGALSGSYTTSSRGFNASEAATVLGAGIFEGSRASGFAAELARKYARGQSGFGDRDRPGDYGIALPSGPGPPGASLLRLLALVAATVMAALALLKLAVRRSRYLTRDPRRLAAAYRHEFVEFLADQGVALPPSATLGEAGALVDQRLAVDTRQFVRAASRARFAPLDEAHHAAGDARRELRRVLRRIRRRVGIRGRLRGTLSVRSLSLSSPQSEQN